MGAPRKNSPLAQPTLGLRRPLLNKSGTWIKGSQDLELQRAQKGRPIVIAIVEVKTDVWTKRKWWRKCRRFMLWQGHCPQNTSPPTLFYCLLSDIGTRWKDSMQSIALIWVGSRELPMQAFCTHLLLPQTTSLVQLPGAVICEIPFRFGTYIRNRMGRTLSRTRVSTWICLLLGYINLLAIPCHFLLRRWRRSATKKDRQYSLLF